MKKLRISITDKNFIFRDLSKSIISNNIFTVIRNVKLEEENLNTFSKRLKWLFFGKI